MFDLLITIREKLIAWKYRYLLKPIFFRLDPEDVHERITRLGQFLGRFAFFRFLTRACFSYQDLILEQTILGIKFKNPVGLAAGFDKEAQLTQILPAVGFGFEEIGSITGEPCAGNPKPRLWRLPKSESLIVYYGLKNQGAEIIAKHLQTKDFTIPIGVSLAKTNNQETASIPAGIVDYLKAYQIFINAKIGYYFTINISCPNTFNGMPFIIPANLALLLTELNKLARPRPIFLKLSPDIPLSDLDQIISLAEQYKISGFISTNLAKDKSNPAMTERIKDTLPTTNGGLSGKVVEGLSDNQLRYLAEKTKGQFILVACGGIFNALDAYRKIRAGASLVQLATGMIFKGPQVIGAINHGLVHLLKQDGFTSITEAVGVDLKV